jgi:hypothetical protein
MAGKSLTPAEIADAVCLRAAGYTVTAISDRTGISLRTLNRVFERHGAKKGAVKDELVQEAKRNLIEGVTSNERIKEEAARMVADDLAHARLLRLRMADAAEHLVATNLDEAALLMRASAAYSTALKNTSDMIRHTLRTDQTMDAAEREDLPELVVTEITTDELLAIRAKAADAQVLPPGDGAPVSDVSERSGSDGPELDDLVEEE